jgi:hypothetical protein
MTMDALGLDKGEACRELAGAQTVNGREHRGDEPKLIEPRVN